MRSYLSTASLTLEPAVATASAPCWAALSIFSPACSAGPFFCSQPVAARALTASSTARTIRIDRIAILLQTRTVATGSEPSGQEQDQHDDEDDAADPGWCIPVVMVAPV